MIVQLECEEREGYLEMQKKRKIISSSLSSWLCSLQFCFSLLCLPLGGILFLSVVSCELLLVLGVIIFLYCFFIANFLLLNLPYLSQCILHHLHLFLHTIYDSFSLLSSSSSSFSQSSSSSSTLRFTYS